MVTTQEVVQDGGDSREREMIHHAKANIEQQHPRN
jgi:hypothetical protein